VTPSGSVSLTVDSRDGETLAQVSPTIRRVLSPGRRTQDVRRVQGRKSSVHHCQLFDFQPTQR